MAKKPADKGEPDHVYLVDGSAYIFRAFHALPPMTRPDGTPVNAVYGFTNMLNKLVEDSEADFLAVIFDTARKTFRSDIYPDYKANRPPPPEELIPQFDLIREATRELGVVLALESLDRHESTDVVVPDQLDSSHAAFAEVGDALETISVALGLRRRRSRVTRGQHWRETSERARI